MGTPWNAASVREAVLRAIEIFGPDRILIATNFPTDRLFGTMDATLAAYAELVADFSDDERRAMWGGNASRIYRLR
jgi:predicted TIM-barrel fold metal-dependent hydrolase